MHRFLCRILIAASIILININVQAQQVPDTSWSFNLNNPKFELGTGPVIAIDEFHHNFHTLEGRYSPFARLLTQDGYQMISFKSTFTGESLLPIDILVISDPMNDQKESAYTPSEVTALIQWISEGGSLFLITDHRPDPPAIQLIARALNLEFLDAYVFNEAPGEKIGPVFFKQSAHTLANHPITRGRKNYSEGIGEVVSFTGTAFRSLDKNVTPLMVLKNHKTAYFTDHPNNIRRNTPRQDVEGWLQGACIEKGKGRVVIMAEAAMFTAQIILQNNNRFGMNADFAPNNPQFLINIIHWLSNIL